MLLICYFSNFVDDFGSFLDSFGVAIKNHLDDPCYFFISLMMTIKMPLDNEFLRRL